MSHIRNIGFNGNLAVGTDIAFILRTKFYRSYQKKTELKTNNYVFCFRLWGEKKEIKEIKNKAVKFCKYFLTLNSSHKITFISTCQGIIGYNDDSLLANEIISLLPKNLRFRCEVINYKMTLFSLIEELSKYEGYIGMRLHAAIFSLLAGIPALNIGYEDKTKGIFDKLGYSNYHFHYKEPIETWFTKTKTFIEKKKCIRQSIDKKLKKMEELARDNVNYLNI